MDSSLFDEFSIKHEKLYSHRRLTRVSCHQHGIFLHLRLGQMRRRPLYMICDSILPNGFAVRFILRRCQSLAFIIL